MKEAQDKINAIEIMDSMEHIESLVHFLPVHEFAASWNAREEIAFELRHISIVASNISKDFKEKHELVEWKRIEELPHQVFDEDMVENPWSLYHLATEEMSELKEQIRESLQLQEEDEDFIYL